ncbi:hypothetical protein [Mesorhizobium sp. B2-5-11]|uniref:hypothetical protein n=1 Tax=Mesorhizobium sp. B2-5-11 TaxID=2589919 RepID=UPI001127267A|nr:hypothetical protein [Mesorhizobium sp. B2-5-11]TPK14144.1 hypothetical protein FJ490_02140 [Mesorhizobium sp. B2-5-11]
MDRTARLQAQRPIQLKLRFGDNDDCPFSAPGPTRSVFNGVLDHRGEQEAKLVRLGLTLRDAIARSGPSNSNAE